MKTTVPLLVMLFVGCNNCASLVPLCSDADAFRDDRVVGTWSLHRIPNDGEKPIISFGDFDDSVSLSISRDTVSTYRLVIRSEEVEIPFRCRIATIGDDRFLSLQRTELETRSVEGTTIRPYFFVRCIISDDSIRLIGCSPEAFRRLTEGNGLPVVEIDSMIVYTGTTAQLREALTTHGSELFQPGKGDVKLARRPATRRP